MKRLIPILLSICLLLMSACSHREVAYITDAQRDSAQDIIQHYTASLMPGDQIYIYVSSQTPESVIPFNQETHTINLEVNRLTNNDSTNIYNRSRNNAQQIKSDGVKGYFVDEHGYIDFPILGKLYVAGHTQDELKEMIESQLKENNYVIDPVVTTRLLNFRVTVVGEVKMPRQIHVDGTRLTILEAIAICGDLTDYGMRENILVIRSDGQKKEYGILDLTKNEMLNSPYYYLHNNDIVYIEPSDLKKKDSDRDENIPRYISMAVSAASIIRTTWGQFVARLKMNN